MDPLKKLGGAPKCGRCNTSVYPMELINYDNISYHKSCFKCLQCKRTLEPRSVAIIKGDVYCKNCFKRIFSERGKYDDFGEKNLNAFAKAKAESTANSPEAPADAKSPATVSPSVGSPATASPTTSAESAPAPAADAPSAGHVRRASIAQQLQAQGPSELAAVQAKIAAKSQSPEASPAAAAASATPAASGASAASAASAASPSVQSSSSGVQAKPDSVDEATATTPEAAAGTGFQLTTLLALNSEAAEPAAEAAFSSAVANLVQTVPGVASAVLAQLVINVYEGFVQPNGYTHSLTVSFDSADSLKDYATNQAVIDLEAQYIEGKIAQQPSKVSFITAL